MKHTAAVVGLLASLALAGPVTPIPQAASVTSSTSSAKFPSRVTPIPVPAVVKQQAPGSPAEAHFPPGITPLPAAPTPAGRFGSAVSAIPNVSQYVVENQAKHFSHLYPSEPLSHEKTAEPPSSSISGDAEDAFFGSPQLQIPLGSVPHPYAESEGKVRHFNREGPVAAPKGPVGPTGHE
ncbi:hypothetical protein DCS_06329 [Drechmeria coniospora]|uniref:Uncharacterized protein n=1 Tax=Drechmeria coniospora TaxID=98403 RepID=A0A151GBF1_DRECN|nr:hypothetical protein DCS_06329 [Drechmeria coniospora]KYK54371.1 hypothetical protein DCS_06329 [Drechmeria coniospora]ODA77343.1 hypothetical protein RJ55_06971 [Drechmeria coniospora]